MNSKANAVITELAQALLAILLVAGGVVIAIIEVARGGNALDLPGWLELGIGTVVGLYFGTKSANMTVTTMADGPMTTLANALQRNGGSRSTDTPAAPPAGGAPAA